jgi:RNA polymerase sigma-70 factor (ECF subfamily)
VTAPPEAPLEALSAEELAVRAREGSRGSFDELVARFRPRLVAFLAGRLREPSDAEDVAQETFLRAYGSLDRYDAGRPFATWLFAIGKNVAASHALAGARRVRREQAGAMIEEAVAPVAPDDLWRRAASTLTPAAYRVLWLRYAQGMTVAEIADEVRRTRIAIKVTLFRARRRLLELEEER